MVGTAQAAKVAPQAAVAVNASKAPATASAATTGTISRKKKVITGM